MWPVLAEPPPAPFISEGLYHKDGGGRGSQRRRVRGKRGVLGDGRRGEDDRSAWPLFLGGSTNSFPVGVAAAVVRAVAVVVVVVVAGRRRARALRAPPCRRTAPGRPHLRLRL